MISLAERARARNVAERTEAAVRTCLMASPYLDLRHVQCHVEDGVLSITGRVPSFYLKQVAQTAVSKIDGVERVENCLEVRLS